MQIGEFFEKHSEGARTSFSLIIKVILIVSIAYALYFHLWRILFINMSLLLLILIIYFVQKKYEIYIPKEVEFVFLIFIFISFFLGEIRGLIIQIFFGLAIGFVGFVIMLILYSNSKLKTDYSLIILFSFSVSVALGLASEMLKYYTRFFLKQPMSITDYNYAMASLTLVAAGSIFASTIGYIYMKGYRVKLLEKLVTKFKKKNPNLFILRTDSPEELLKLIGKGENEKLEFKATLRTNLHTGEIDKNMECAVLKTITAFLNTGGGSLLVGISDDKKIIGIEHDKFPSNDKFSLHFSNLLIEKIGKEFLPYMNSELILVEGKTILKVECIKSDKPVFFRGEKEEEFFIRIGPASVKISGSKLINYINNNFKKV